MSDNYTLTIGDYVTVAVPGSGGRVDHYAKGRLTGWDTVPTIDGRHKRRPVVTYTSTTGEPYAVARRHRGDCETVPAAWVTPRGFQAPGRVIFRQGPEEVYADAPPVVVVDHVRHGTSTTGDVA